MFIKGDLLPRKKVNVKKEIKDALKKNKSLTWSQLAKITGLSKGSLSKYLNFLIKTNQVSTKTELRGRSQVTHYSLTDNRFINALMYMEERLEEEKSWLDEQYLETFISILQECERLKLVPKGYFIKHNAGRKVTPEELNKIYADIEKQKREYEEKQKRRKEYYREKARESD